jgi:hypothetical protein
MGLQIRDERQMKALTGLSQAQFDSLLPVFSDLYRAAQQHAYEERSQSGTRRRRPGGGSKGKLPTMVEKLLFVLYYYGLPIAFPKKWPYDLPMNRVWSGRRGFEADLNRFALIPQVHRTQPCDDLHQQAVIRPR